MRQLEVVSRRLLAGLAAETPVLADAAVMAHLDIESTQRRVYGHAKAEAGFGAAKVGGYPVRLCGLGPLLAAVSTPTCAPVLVGTRLRGGTANSARGASDQRLRCETARIVKWIFTKAAGVIPAG